MEDQTNNHDDLATRGGGVFGGEEAPPEELSDADLIHHDEQQSEQSPAPSAKPKTSAAPKKSGMSKMKKWGLIGVGVLILFGGILLFSVQQPAPTGELDQGLQEQGNTIDNGFTQNVEPASAVQPVEQQSSIQVQSAPASAPVSAETTASQPATQQPAAGADPRYDSLDARVTRIENFLTQAAQQSSEKQRQKKAAIKHKPSKPKQMVATVTAADAIRSPGTDAGHQPDQIVGTITRNEVDTIKLTATEVQKPLPVVCEYRGALNNRAWVACGEDLYSVKPGDKLPSPYGAVTSVNDQAGNVGTVGGLIQ